MATAQQCTPAKEPQLRASYDSNALVWSYPEEYQARNFKDVKPFGSLDEVIIKNLNGEITILNPGDPGFEEQKAIYQKEVYPKFEKWW